MSDITQSELKELLDYNPDTGVFVWKVSRGREKRGNVGGSLHPDGYRYIQINGRRYLAHRLAWLYVYGQWPVDEIDHENHKRDCNCITNLCEATRKLNSRNRSLHKNNSSGTVGVVWKPRDKKWEAQIHHNGKHISGGLHADINDAIAKRKQLEKQYGFHDNHGMSRDAAYIWTQA